MKKLFFLYQRVMFYTNQAKGEYGKIGSFIPETLSLITYLTVTGVTIKAWYIPVAYLLLIILAAGIGKFLVVIGVTAYNNRLSNEQNHELKQIKADLEIIKDKLNG